MKKITIALICLTALLLTACNNKPSGETSSTAETTTTQTATHKEKETSTTEQMATHKETAMSTTEQTATHKEKETSTTEQTATHKEKKTSTTEQTATPSASKTAAGSRQVVGVFTREGDTTEITLYSDGIAAVSIDSNLRIWTDYADPNVEGEEGEEARRRETIRENIALEREIPSGGVQIKDVYLFASSPSIPGEAAYAAIRVEGDVYYYIDLVGFDTLGEAPVILRELDSIRGKDVKTIEFRTDTKSEGADVFVGDDYLYAIYEDGSEELIYTR